MIRIAATAALGLAVLVGATFAGFRLWAAAPAKRPEVQAELAALRTAPYEGQRVVYHLTEDGEAAARLGSVANHLAAVGANGLQARIVLQGRGVRVLRTAAGDPALRARIDGLREAGVVFLVCRNSLVDQDIALAELYGVTPQTIVGAGVAEVAALQMKGFAYIRL